MNYTAPGVYIEEISNLGSSIAEVPTAIPGFVGYTEKNGPEELKTEQKKPIHKATPITSMLDYEKIFGLPFKETIKLKDDKNTTETELSNFRLYYHMQLYFANGGGFCYVVSAGSYYKKDNAENSINKSINKSMNKITKDALEGGIKALKDKLDVTLLVTPEAIALVDDNRASVYTVMLEQCVSLKNRFAIFDGPENIGALDKFRTDVITESNVEKLKYAAAYFPMLKTTLNYAYQEDKLPPDKSSVAYNKAIEAINNFHVELSPSATMAGVYAQVDANLGVWQAPANVALKNVIAPSVNLTEAEQGVFNFDSSSGKSIDVIRAFPGQGTLVWGARTLAGNSNDWRFVSVKRLFITIETSVKRAVMPYCFQPNTSITWLKIKNQINSFLTSLWSQGAMAGATAEEAFHVRVDLGETMTPEDIQNGKLIVEVSIAPTRPAEFIVLRFSQMLQQA